MKALISDFTGGIPAVATSKGIVVRIPNFTGFAAEWHIAVTCSEGSATAHALFNKIMGHNIPPYNTIIDQIYA